MNEKGTAAPTPDTLVAFVTHKLDEWMVYLHRETDIGLGIVCACAYSRSEARDKADMAQLVRALVS